jgi:lipoate-protein ligase A
MNSESWRIIPPAFARCEAGEDLALSESLLANVHSPTLRWYSASKPAFILGTSQKPEIMDKSFCNANNLKIYRRTSGGTLVLAEPSFLSLDIALPPQHPLALPDITETYRWLGEIWVETLQELGVQDARLVSVGEVREARARREILSPEKLTEERLAGQVCFGALSPYEVVLEDGRKLVGLSQVRRRSGTLLQCGIPMLYQIGRLVEAQKLADYEKQLQATVLARRMLSLEEALKNSAPEFTVITEFFDRVICNRLNINSREKDWLPEELETATSMESTRFLPL